VISLTLNLKNGRMVGAYTETASSLQARSHIMANAQTSTSPDFAAIKAKQQATWSSGDYASVAATIHYMSELLCEAIELRAGEHLLDVATGSGNAAIAAARRGARVIGIDYAPRLLQKAQLRADAEGVEVDLLEADAEALPFPDDSFDSVVSVVGVMFAPNQPQAAAELIRVCRPGGLVALANWTPDGFIGALLRLVGSFVPPPPGLTPPTRWGTQDGIAELLGNDIEYTFIDRTHRFNFESAAKFAEFFIQNYGPTERAYTSLEPDRRAEFSRAIANLAAEHNVATDGTLVVHGAYLEVHARVPW
jgi:ubiquinone/menaquinone biosynthesis C-methylase UbiE